MKNKGVPNTLLVFWNWKRVLLVS